MADRHADRLLADLSDGTLRPGPRRPGPDPRVDPAGAPSDAGAGQAARGGEAPPARASASRGLLARSGADRLLDRRDGRKPRPPLRSVVRSRRRSRRVRP